MNTLDLFREISDWNSLTSYNDGRDVAFVHLQIEDDAIVGFYKTRVVKYKNVNNEDVSYLFPTTFSNMGNITKTTMLFGMVENNFHLPDNINGAESYPDSYVMNLKTVSVDNHLYKLLVAEMHGMVDTKPFICIIEDLESRGFPFMRIAGSIESNKSY